MPSWNPPTRKPAAYRTITCLGNDGKEYAGLCYASYFSAIIEPITGALAEPVIGPIKGWRYE